MPNDTLNIEACEQRLRWALLLRSWGHIPLPLEQREKRPIVNNWPAFPMPSEPMLRQWIVGEGRNYGVLCGARSNNLVVVDFDNEQAYSCWSKRDISTFVVRSARGVHLYFTMQHLPAHKHKMEHGGGDVLTTGAYVVAPGSIHPTGATYSVVNDCAIRWIESLDELELPLERKAAQHPAHRGTTYSTTSMPPNHTARIDGIVEAFRAAVEGNRNSMLLWSACRCFDAGMSRSDVEALLAPVAMQLGLSQSETLRTIASAQMQDRRAITPPPMKQQLTPRERQARRRK